MSIITAALDNRVKGLVSYYPALCDMVGYLHGRAGGWPHFLKDEKIVLRQEYTRQVIMMW